MRKYWAVFKITWQNSVEYLMEFFAHVVLGIIILTVLIFVWTAVFKQVSNFGGYTLSSMITYLVMVRFLHFTTRGNITRLVADEIKEGKLSIYLLKPFNYLGFWFSSFWADRLFECLVRLSVLVLFIVILPQYFRFPPVFQVISFFLFLVISLLLNFLLNVLIASAAFWVTDIRLFSTTLGLSLGFLAGKVIPVDIMPGALKDLSLFLPFQYTLYFPIKIFQGRFIGGEILRGVLVSLIWLVVFFWLLLFLWKRGLKKYEAVGQ